MKYENNPAAMKSLRDWKSVDQWAAVNGGGGGGVGGFGDSATNPKNQKCGACDENGEKNVVHSHCRYILKIFWILTITR